MLSSHLKRSLLLQLQDKSHLSQPKTGKRNGLVFHWCLCKKQNTTQSLGDSKFIFSKFHIFVWPCNMLQVSVLNRFFYRPKAEVSKLRPPGTITAQPKRTIHPYALISGHPGWWTLGSPNTFAQQHSQIPLPRTILLHKNVTPQGQQLVHMKPQP